MSKDNQKRIAYVKPKVVDVGALLNIQGSLCGTGSFPGNCAGGSGQADACVAGFGAAAGQCNGGMNAAYL